MATKKKAARKTPAKRAVAPKAPPSAVAKPKKAAKAVTRAVGVAASDSISAPPGGALVVVESPTKARTISKYLGRGYTVLATVGHVMDLPEKKMGIDIDHSFEPEYVTIAGKEKTLEELRGAAKDSDIVYLATDPDREGEAIAWHVETQVKQKKGGPAVKRVLFHEITKDAVRKAIANAGAIDRGKVDAQQARRVLDRLVGYKASPILWKTVKKGLSAGRVQTVALRIIVEREHGIRAFKAVEYWTIEAILEKDGQRFAARLHQIDGKKPEITNEKQALAIVDAVKSRQSFAITEIKRRERRKNPQAPFTTSTIQQEAAKKLGFGSKRTMRAAQRLYEGVPLGKEGSVGLITYMRTDSSRIAESAALAARDELRKQFGEDHLAAGPQLFGAAKDANAQDAHEAIRPTDPARHPDSVAPYLKGRDLDLLKLYQLIWQRFMASQMAPAVFDTTTADFAFNAKGRDVMFRSTGSIIKFKGFLALYKEAREEGEGKALEDEQALPPLAQGENIPVREVLPHQHFTEPPPRFSEASLVRELEKDGIGRPSTYASIISVLVDRRYVNLEQRRFFPTELGEQVLKVMLAQFPAFFEVGFTRDMESELDKIEDGRKQWQKSIKEFYKPFAEALADVDVTGLIRASHDLTKLATERCPKCGGKLEPKGGFFGPFVACENHPKTCDYTRPLKGERKPVELTTYKCPVCGEFMVVRHGRSGDFLGCSKFPKCRGTKSMPTGVKCPKDGGDIAERKSKKRGKTFYGCENYPQCDFVCWDKPVAETCPDCGNVGVEAKSSKARGSYRKCLKCGNEWDVAEQPMEAETVEV